MYGPETFIVRVAGDGMAPRLADGDFAYIDPDEPARDGRIVGVRDPETGETVARLLVVDDDGSRVLRALHPEVPDREVTRDNETEICGVVVFAGNVVRALYGRTARCHWPCDSTANPGSVSAWPARRSPRSTTAGCSATRTEREIEMLPRGDDGWRQL